MVIRQGDVFWVNLDEPEGSEPGGLRPAVIIQNNIFNRSRIATTIVALLTSNLVRAHVPGNILLAKGQANLPRRSVVNVSHVLTINKSDLRKKIGTLSPSTVRTILDGLSVLLEPREA